MQISESVLTCGVRLRASFEQSPCSIGFLENAQCLSVESKSHFDTNIMGSAGHIYTYMWRSGATSGIPRRRGSGSRRIAHVRTCVRTAQRRLWGLPRLCLRPSFLGGFKDLPTCTHLNKLVLEAPTDQRMKLNEID